MSGGLETTFPGIFSCAFDESKGRCIGSAETLADTTIIGGKRERGAHLSNIRLGSSENKLFALRTDSLWEILWAPLDFSDTYASSSTSATSLLSYFRIPKTIYTDQTRGQDCGKYNGTRFAYYEVLPVAFGVDENDDVFISWEGYFQDCADAIESENGLVWSIGINKVERKCLMSDNVQSFGECSTPFSILYRGLLGKDRRLGNGLEMSSSPAGRRLFYLTVVNRAYEVDNANELWVAPPGIHKLPNVIPTPGIPGATGYQATRIIPDVASLRLKVDSDKLPRSVCQTAYTKGVFCFSFQIEDDGENVVAYSEDTEPIFVVNEQQVIDSCVIDTSVGEGEEYMSGMTTGLEVVWGSDDRPDVVLFGCYGRLAERGNMTAVLRDGSATQVLPGAYPGSLLFGIEVPNQGRDFFWGDVTSVPVGEIQGVESAKEPKWSIGIIVSILFSVILFVTIMVLWYSRAKSNETLPASATSEKGHVSTQQLIEIMKTSATSKLDEDSIEIGKESDVSEER